MHPKAINGFVMASSMVENAVTRSKSDEEQKLNLRENTRLNELKQLEALFNLMDSDGSGTLSWDEFKAAFNDAEMSRKWKLLDFEPEDCKSPNLQMYMRVRQIGWPRNRGLWQGVYFSNGVTAAGVTGSGSGNRSERSGQ